MIKKALLFILITAIGTINAQDAIVKGLITDGQTQEPLIGALIMVEGTELAVESDLEGNYSVSVPPGTHNVIISYETYHNDTLKNLTLTSGQILYKNVQMEVVANQLGTVVITYKVEKTNEAALIKDKQEAVGAIDVISAETFKKTSDRSTSDVLKRVTGASIQDGRFAIIRGVNDRYNTGYLNGSLLPSTESDRKAFSFEVIPANMVDNIMIMKTATPDLPGEFGGGVIRINTKAVPAKLTHSLGIAGQVNSITTFKDFSAFKGASTDFIGLDNGMRKLPSYGSLGSNIAPEIRTAQTLKFNNDWSIKKVNAMPNVRLNYTLGAPIKIKGKDNFGFVFVLNYSDTRTLRTGELFNVEAQDGRSSFKYADTSSRRNVNTGALLNFEYKINDSNKVYFRNLYNISTDFNFTKRDGYAIVSEAAISYNTFAEMMRSNRFYNGQVSGSHKAVFSGIGLFWNMNYIKINRDMPDYRIASYETTYDEEGNANPKRLAINDFFNSSTGRFFSRLDEKVYSPSVDLKKTIKTLGASHELKLGGLYQYRERLFNSNTFVYKSKKSGIVYEGVPNEDIGNSSIEEGNLFLEERPNALGSYYGKSSLATAYLMSDSKVGEKLRLVYGLRYENFTQKILGSKTDDNEIANQSSASWLPSANLTYMITKKSNLRLAAFKSVNRPEFRELAEFAFFDFDINSELVGNPNLKIATIKNFDARFEFFPNMGEIVSVGGFFKEIDQPIEFVIDRASQTIRQFRFRNEKQAKVFGIELEVRKSLDFISKRKFFTSSTVFSNISVVRSFVSLNPDATTLEGRPLQGQSPYLLNIGYSLDDENTGWGLGFMFNRIGRRIFALGNPVDTDYFKDYYENPRSVIDLQVSKRIQKFLVKATIGDLLRQDLIIYQDYNGNGKFDNLGNDNFKANNDLVMMRYKMGRTITLGLSYDF